MNFKIDAESLLYFIYKKSHNSYFVSLLIGIFKDLMKKKIINILGCRDENPCSFDFKGCGEALKLLTQSYKRKRGFQRGRDILKIF